MSHERHFWATWSPERDGEWTIWRARDGESGERVVVLLSNGEAAPVPECEPNKDGVLGRVLLDWRPESPRPGATLRRGIVSCWNCGGDH